MIERYNQNNERRIQTVPVAFDRRSKDHKRNNNGKNEDNEHKNGNENDESKIQSELAEIKKQNNCFINQINKYDSFVKQNTQKQQKQITQSSEIDYSKAAALFGAAVIEIHAEDKEIVKIKNETSSQQYWSLFLNSILKQPYYKNFKKIFECNYTLWDIRLVQKYIKQFQFMYLNLKKYLSLNYKKSKLFFKFTIQRTTMYPNKQH